ncbi:unnamed protein product [Ambrosiozyma monospora]|uniref:Unnamed protein product n=1 Tax=Ambrosiozyma monospora TaxID=43982 RepID=A0ACB5SZK5_AMBMO|nr:unnamed protein product [Ambrosiozyma monospora]
MLQRGKGRLTTTVSIPVEEYIDLFEVDTEKVDFTGVKNVIIKLLNFRELRDYFDNYIESGKATFEQFYDYSFKCHEFEIKAYRIITEYNKTILNADPEDSDNRIIHSPRYLGHGWCCLNSNDIHFDGYFLAIEKLEFHERKPQTKAEFATGIRDIELMAELGIEHGDLALRNMCYNGDHVYFFDFNRVELGVLNSQRLIDEYKTQFVDNCEEKVAQHELNAADTSPTKLFEKPPVMDDEDPTELGVFDPTEEAADVSLIKP